MLSSANVRILRRQIDIHEPRLPLVFSALSDKSRFKMFMLMLQHKNLCVTDMANVLNITVPAASQQLKVLEVAGLISPERRGQQICYKVKTRDALVRSVIRIVNNYLIGQTAL